MSLRVSIISEKRFEGLKKIIEGAKSEYLSLNKVGNFSTEFTYRPTKKGKEKVTEKTSNSIEKQAKKSGANIAVVNRDEEDLRPKWRRYTYSTQGDLYFLNHELGPL